MPVPFRPSPPVAPFFQPARNAWVFSRHADVSSALQSTSLCQCTWANEPTVADEKAQHAKLFAEVQADIARLSAEAWRTQMEETLLNLMQRAKRQGQVDLVREVIHPWAATMLVLLNGGRAFHSRRLVEISERLFYGPADDDDTPQDDEPRPASFEKELEHMLETRQLLPCRSMFFGLTQTLPSFLAKAWLALLLHPDQMARAGDDPGVMTSATEELLRFAGVVHTLYRRCMLDTRIGGVTVREGQMAILEVDAANFDPEKFEQPERLELMRRATGHLGLGTGMHACVGSFLVRMACSVATPVFVAAGPQLLEHADVLWTGTERCFGRGPSRCVFAVRRRLALRYWSTERRRSHQPTDA
jgi:cytochrome P450